MSSNPDLLLVKGEVLPDEIIIAAEARDKLASRAQGPDRDSEDGDRKAEEEHCGEDGGRCNFSAMEVREKGSSKGICCGKRSLGGDMLRVDADDDGFRTPVSAEHRIATAAECPPAPKKPKPVPWRKRKLPPSDEKDDSAISLIIHVPDEELEAMLLPTVPSEARSKIKKARRDDSHE